MERCIYYEISMIHLGRRWGLTPGNAHLGGGKRSRRGPDPAVSRPDEAGALRWGFTGDRAEWWWVVDDRVAVVSGRGTGGRRNAGAWAVGSKDAGPGALGEAADVVEGALAETTASGRSKGRSRGRGGRQR